MWIDNEWVLGVAGLTVYCLGYVAAVGIRTRWCECRASGHRYKDYDMGGVKDCSHATQDPAVWAWPLVLAVLAIGVVVVGPFVAPWMLTRRAAQKVEARIRAGQAGEVPRELV